MATTAVSCNDLKARRKDDYDFSWERALQSTGNKSGIRLQYNHARLASLIEKNKHSMFGDQSVLEFTNGKINGLFELKTLFLNTSF